MRKNLGKNKFRTIKGKIVATSLALALSFSAFGFNTANVSAAETDVNITSETEFDIFSTADSLLDRITDEDIEAMKKVGLETLLEIFGKAVPGGEIMKPALSGLLGSSILGHETSLDDVNNNINGLYDRIDQFEKDMKDELKNIISIENFDYGPFTDLNSMIKGITNSIKNAQDNYSAKEQLAIIGAQIGKDLDWKKGDSPFVKFTSTTDKMIKAHMLGSDNLFELVYNYFAQRSMFSGEAIDNTRVVIDEITQYYYAAYGVLLECLTAQLAVNQLENTDGIDPYYLDNISTNVSEIKQKINELNSTVLGVVRNGFIDDRGTVNDMYNNIKFRDRRILVDNNKGNDYLKGRCSVIDHKDLNNRKDDCAVGVLKDLLPNDRVSYGKNKDLADYARAKGMTVREFLEANGINTCNVPKNANLITSDPYDNLSIGAVLTGLYGSVDLKGLYKGYNIDEKNPTEKEYTMWKNGCTGFMLGDSWDRAEPGYIVTLDIFD